jgi:hypothetical protein
MIISMMMIGDRAGGDWSTTYAPKPLYITNFNRSVVFENTEMMFFDLRDDDAVIVEVYIHIYTYTYTYIYTYTYTYTYMYIHIHIHLYKYVYIC